MSDPLAALLHAEHIGCESHAGDDPDVAQETHRTDAARLRASGVRGPEDAAALLPAGWALTVTYHPAPESRWIASAWSFHGGVSKGHVDAFGRSEAEALDALRAALGGQPRE